MRRFGEEGVIMVVRKCAWSGCGADAFHKSKQEVSDRAHGFCFFHAVKYDKWIAAGYQKSKPRRVA